MFILILAWINYINLSTIRAIERAREVGVRKVMGSTSNQLKLQFILESVIVNVIAATIAYLIALSILPFLKIIADPNLIPGDMLNSFWLKALIVLITGSLLSGLYPAFILSNYNPNVILKGKLAQSKMAAD